MKLSSQSIRAAKPGDVLRDDLVPGLHLRVRAESAGFFLHYRAKEGRERRPKLGDARVMSLTQARDRAREMLLEVANGGDPSGETIAGRAAPTVADLCERYLADDAVKAKKSYFKDERIIRVYLLPRFKNRKVASMEPADFDAMRKEMKTAPYQFNRCLALASTLFGPRFAEKWKMRPEGTKPTAGVRRYPEKKRRRYMKPDEALAIARLLDEAEAIAPASVAFIRLLILTGARPDEIARTRWDWVQAYETSDPSTGKTVRAGVIYDSNGKTGERAIFLSPAAQGIVDSLPKLYDTITGIRSPQKLWRRIRKDAGCPDLRLYDLRHSFASVAIGLGMTLAEIGELLGHASDQTTKRYAHLMDEHKQERVARIATAIGQRGQHENGIGVVYQNDDSAGGPHVVGPGTVLNGRDDHGM